MQLPARSRNALLTLVTLQLFSSHVAVVEAALNPGCRPGGNFDLSKWALETPIDNGKGQPLVISAQQLSGGGGKDGCKNGWQDKGSDHQWFFTVSARIPFYLPVSTCLRAK
jgi:hypothetical protein